MLLKELQYNTKNNMQVISSIIGLKRSALTDENTIIILKEIENRFKSMALVHRKLYQAKDYSRVESAGITVRSAISEIGTRRRAPNSERGVPKEYSVNFRDKFKTE